MDSAFTDGIAHRTFIVRSGSFSEVEPAIIQ
jgi:hypothetical protein